MSSILAAPAAPVASVNWDEVASALRAAVSASTRVAREEPLGGRTTLGVGGAARLLVEPAGLEDLRAVARIASGAGLALLPLGRGSNLVVPDDGVDAVVLSLGHPAWSEFSPRSDGRVWAGAGLRLKNLCGQAVKAGLQGFEFLEGIPGSVGGSLRMNAGAMGGWIFDLVEEVKVFGAGGEVLDLPRAGMGVDYRHCRELESAIALGALFRPAARGEGDAIGRQIDVYRRKRQETQPRERSAGCVFRNPPGGAAGRLIDEAGLKGTRVGDAQVSPVHANFIVNLGAARAADVMALMRQVRARVLERSGVLLQPEVLCFGRRWEDFL
jgi:UDP-N-acetylenolpyruvoylglucosamine reductase